MDTRTVAIALSDGSQMTYAADAVTYQQMNDGGLKVVLYYHAGSWAAIGRMKDDFVPELCAEGQGWQLTLT